MSKPYLVTVASWTKGVPRFAESLKHIENYVEHISIQFQPFIPEFRPYKTYDEPYCGNQKRFEMIPTLDDNRFIIFSDTDDVVFQRALPDFERMKYECYLASENEIHINSYWKGFIERNPYFEGLNQKMIYNDGMFAMRVSIFKKLVTFMKNTLQFIEEKDRPTSDQMLFNLFFLKNPYYDIYKGLDIFCPFYNNLQLGLIKSRKGLFTLNDGHVPVAVHANGTNKDIFEDGRKANRFVKTE